MTPSVLDPSRTSATLLASIGSAGSGLRTAVWFPLLGAGQFFCKFSFIKGTWRIYPAIIREMALASMPICRRRPDVAGLKPQK